MLYGPRLSKRRAKMNKRKSIFRQEKPKANGEGKGAGGGGEGKTRSVRYAREGRKAYISKDRRETHTK